MTNSNTKGSRRERQLIDVLQAEGFGVMRAPASGSATTRSLPDVLAGRPDEQYSMESYVDCLPSEHLTTLAEVYAIELKASAGDAIYIEGHEIGKLTAFAERFGARPVVVVKFDVKHGDPAYGEAASGFYAFAPDDLHVTDGGNYRVKKERALSGGTAVEGL